MGPHHTGRRGRNSSSTTSTTRRTRSPAVASSRRPSSPPTSINKAGAGGDRKVRTGRHRDDAAVRRKMEALRRLVPVSHDGDRDDELLLRAAAGYIARLQAQVRVMQLMVDVLEHAGQD